MKLRLCLIIVTLIDGHPLLAQQPEPDDVLYGHQTSTGASDFARYELRWPDGQLEIMFAPFGRVPALLEDVELSADHERRSFRWPDGASCELSRSPTEGWSWRGLVSEHWVGTCVPIAGTDWQITVGMATSPDYGQYLPATESDLRIIDRASELLEGDGSWNASDDRVCEDDDRLNSRSLFCALYRASLDVTGEYLHARRAMDLVRLAIREATGLSYVHTLRDYNNHPETTVEQIRDRLREGREKVSREVYSPF